MLSRRLLQLSAHEARPVLAGAEAARHDGGELDRLIRRRVLIERPPAEEWPVCPGCECDLDMRPVHRSPSRLLAACPFDARSDTELTEADLRSFEVDLAAMLRAMVEDSGWTGPVSPVQPDLWLLTPTVPTPSGDRMLFFARHVAADGADALIAVVRTIKAQTPATMLMPRASPPTLSLRFQQAGMFVVAAADAIAATKPQRPFAIEAGALAPAVEAGLHEANDRQPSPGEREIQVRIEIAARRVRVHGVGLRLSPLSFDLLRILTKEAAKGSPLVLSRDLHDQLFSANASPKAVIHAVHGLRQELAEGGVNSTNCAGLIENLRATGYRLTVPSNRIEVEE